MPYRCTLRSCPRGQTLPLASALSGLPAHQIASAPLPPAFPVGTVLSGADGAALFMVTGRAWLPAAGVHARACPLLTALQDVRSGAAVLTAEKRGRTLAWITLSDKGSRGEREDTSGPAIEELVRHAMPLAHAQGFLLPDDGPALSALLMELALGQEYDCICTTGGTGVGPRDVSPQATRRVLDYELPGFAQAMMQASLAKTPHAAISRACAGVLGRSILINLPGSRKAVLENLVAVLPALPHALDKLHGDPADCGAHQ
ncbi:MAG: MogA/MoaB family molybdenum cofactor biosynthesis protein [Desulfovibrionaceae bacterium]